MSNTLLVVIAHPDDEGFGIAGTMARMAEEGHQVTLVCATRGEVGEISAQSDATPETLGAVREQELYRAMGVLGVEDVRFLDYRDSGMRGTPENDDPRSLLQAEPLEVAMDLTAIMQEVNPDVVVTWDPSGGYGHPDHIKVHETTTEAFASYKMRVGRPVRLYYTALPLDLFVEMGEELQARGIEWGSPRMREEAQRLERLPVTTIVDVEPYMTRKRQAIAEHRSQMMPEMPWDVVSEDLKRRMLGYEYFHRAEPPWHEGEPNETSIW
jgi:N-acetyl-1-D-myo-inositol-2-amino-2-deoxy-alpha-D-glucopyranoside deacetylase